MKKVRTGLDVLCADKKLQSAFKGNVALLCHNASVDSKLIAAPVRFKEMFKDRFIKLFGPQHGFSTDAQDNMIESDHYWHPHFKMQVFSLYSETRIPTDAMLEGIDHLFVDLQDVGCRMYTYMYTLTLLLEKCVDKAIEIIVLDRPNPLNGVTLEGTLLEPEFESFIGRHPIPVRHGMTIGEVALMHQKFWVSSKIKLRVIKMENWERHMYFEQTGLPWLLPSPNLARVESVFTFPAIVLFEGTLLSEGRGTSQPLEIVGHPSIEPFSFCQNHLSERIKLSKLHGFALRPMNFIPTFEKNRDKVCGGFQLHITDRKVYQPWRVGQFMMRELYHFMGSDFEWRKPPFEYDDKHQPIDIINGTDKLRHWVENNESIGMLNEMEHLEDYRLQLDSIKIYEHHKP